MPPLPLPSSLSRSFRSVPESARSSIALPTVTETTPTARSALSTANSPTVAEPGQLLPAMVTTLATSLRLPYVAIESAHSGIPLAAHGDNAGRVERWPLIHEGTVEGFLIARPRRGEDSFDRRDRRLLEDVARHAGVAVHAEALTADLTESRQRLVTALEEERRRLRRDLHDGLGPVLTAVGLNIDAARSRLTTDPLASDQHLNDAREATRQALDDIRRLVHGLRPPALDNLGLVGALELHLSRLTPAHCCVVVHAETLPCLPAAVEVAAYRIAVEAVTNTIRHTTASACNVGLTTEGETLVVTICDDGGSKDSVDPRRRHPLHARTSPRSRRRPHLRAKPERRDRHRTAPPRLTTRTTRQTPSHGSTMITDPHRRRPPTRHPRTTSRHRQHRRHHGRR